MAKVPLFSITPPGTTPFLLELLNFRRASSLLTSPRFCNDVNEFPSLFFPVPNDLSLRRVRQKSLPSLWPSFPLLGLFFLHIRLFPSREPVFACVNVSFGLPPTRCYGFFRGLPRTSPRGTIFFSYSDPAADGSLWFHRAPFLPCRDLPLEELFPFCIPAKYSHFPSRTPSGA